MKDEDMLDIQGEKEKQSDSVPDKGAMSQHYDTQTYLYAGYAYLLMMGILHEAFFYGMLGVNIISYSNVLDVLLSPLVLLIDNVALMVATFIMPVVAYFYLKLIRYFTLKTKKQIKLKSHKLVTDSMKNQVFVMTAIMIFSGFVGFGIGNGFKAKEKLGNSELKPNHEVDFRNGETKLVHMVGSNSGFLFYVEDNADVVTISPFQENILALKKIPAQDVDEVE